MSKKYHATITEDNKLQLTPIIEKPQYTSWAHLNDEGMKELGDIFPEKTIPIVSIIHISFKHPTLKTPETAYILKGKDLTEEQLTKLIEKTAHKFGDEDKKEEIKQAILDNQVPVRTCLTSGAGTKNVHMFLPDYGFDEEEEDWWDEDDYEEEWEEEEWY